MQDKEKAYVAEVAFGAATDTQDAQGTVTAVGENWPDEAALRAALERFTGTFLQTPPMFSALKQDGRRLYELARSGVEREIPPREVTVHALELRAMTQPHAALLAVRCSKGFYVRTLCHDLGKAVGCPAHMRFLLRTQSGPFTLETAHTLEALERAREQDCLCDLLLPPQAALRTCPWRRFPPGWKRPCVTADISRGSASKRLPAPRRSREAPFACGWTARCAAWRSGRAMRLS